MMIIIVIQSRDYPLREYSFVGKGMLVALLVVMAQEAEDTSRISNSLDGRSGDGLGHHVALPLDILLLNKISLVN